MFALDEHSRAPQKQHPSLHKFSVHLGIESRGRQNVNSLIVFARVAAFRMLGIDRTGLTYEHNSERSMADSNERKYIRNRYRDVFDVSAKTCDSFQFFAAHRQPRIFIFSPSRRARCAAETFLFLPARVVVAVFI